MPADAEALARFSGTVRLFPLPNHVLFPHVLQGLHIFEPRYRALMADALAGDKLMALVLLRERGGSDTLDRPAIEQVACLGRIATHEQLKDGRFNLRLHGIARIRLFQELDTAKPYRVARAEVLPEESPQSFGELKKIRTLLADAVLPRFQDDGPARGQLEDLFHGDTPLGPLCDMLAYALPLPIDLKQQLLAECDVKIRCEVLADALMVKTASRDRKFPPDFSNN